MRLQDYPRPANDNGLGIHLGKDLRPVTYQAYLPRIVDMRMKWCLVPAGDELQLASVAAALAQFGVMPIARWVTTIDFGGLDFVRFVPILNKLGLPAYIQIFNEPGDIREWKSGSPNFDQFVQRWCQHADLVATAGGYPGLQVLTPDELRTVLQALKAGNANNVIDRMWFCPHPYGANHPPDYPYDTLNQHDHPGATVFEDDVTVLGWLEFEPIFQQELGFIPPFIAGEGGWQYGNAEDNRYPRVEDLQHAQYHTALFNSFRTRLLPNGRPLPDYFFAFCPWLLYGADADAWYSWTTGTRQQTVISVQSIPSFVRQFDWNVASRHPVAHYMLFGSPAEQATRSMLIGARKYVMQFGPTLGFSAQDAALAQRVTIVGDSRAIAANVEKELRDVGCRVERLDGDQYAADLILGDRVARTTEFG